MLKGLGHEYWVGVATDLPSHRLRIYGILSKKLNSGPWIWSKHSGKKCLKLSKTLGKREFLSLIHCERLQHFGSLSDVTFCLRRYCSHKLVYSNVQLDMRSGTSLVSHTLPLVYLVYTSSRLSAHNGYVF